jgi:hypothetical protein
MMDFGIDKKSGVKFVLKDRYWASGKVPCVSLPFTLIHFPRCINTAAWTMADTIYEVTQIAVS